MARYSQKVQKDRAEWEEREVHIYESADDIKDYCKDFQSQQEGSETQKHPPVLKGPFRGATVCLRVLCLLMLAGIIILSTCLTLEINQLQTKYDELSSNYSELQVKLSGKRCPEGWKRFGCSCYFKFTEKETWEQSRKACQERGADLVIIDSKEEQKFVVELNMNGESWIGLQRTSEKLTPTTWEWHWKWVDGLPLTEMFWAAEVPNSTSSNYAACCNEQGQWTQGRHYDIKNFMCEK